MPGATTTSANPIYCLDCITLAQLKGKDEQQRIIAQHAAVHGGTALNPAATPQPPPAEGGEVVLFQVINDLKARAEAGAQKYGGPLKTNNGRSAKWDKYQELLDACMYARQEIMEEELPATSLQAQIQRLSWAMVNTDGETRIRLDKIEDQLEEMALVLEHLTTNLAYMAAKRNIKLLNVSGYPRTEE